MSGVPSALIVGVTHDKVTLRVGCCSGFDATIVTAVEAVLEPPGPVQVSVKMLFGAVSRPVLALPVVGRTPPHHVPPATQLVAFVEDQVSIELSPNRMLLGLAASVIAGSWPGGAGGGELGAQPRTERSIQLHAVTLPFTQEGRVAGVPGISTNYNQWEDKT